MENTAGRRFCDQCGASLASACPGCGADNRPEARFCGDCGLALTPVGASASSTLPGLATSSDSPSPSESVAERRLVSVLFAALVAFTRYSEGRDPELVRETLTRYFEATREVIERHGGVVEKFIGDAVVAENWRYWVAYVQLTALTFLPGEPAFAGWAEDARARLELLGAVQDLRLLDEALAQTPSTAPMGSRLEVGSGR